jgi:hypothetical protein
MLDVRKSSPVVKLVETNNGDFGLKNSNIEIRNSKYEIISNVE